MVVFLSVQLFSEGKLYSSTSLIYFYYIAYKTYEFIQDPEVVFSEAQANVELTEAPNSDSEESKTTDSINTDTGKPRCIIPLF